MGQPEGYIESYLVAQCAKAGLEICWKMKCPSTNGVPDRFIAGFGHVAFVEAKRPGGKPRKLQDKRIAQMRHAGCHVEVIDTKEQVDDFVYRMCQPGSLLYPNGKEEWDA